MGCVDRWTLHLVPMLPPFAAAFVSEEIILFGFPFTKVQLLEQGKAQG